MLRNGFKAFPPQRNLAVSPLLTLEHGSQLPHTQAPDGGVLAQRALQKEERNTSKDERQKIRDQEGPWRGETH